MTRRPSITVLSKDDKPIASFGDLYGDVVQVSELPPALPAAVMAVEDRNFYDHFGVDPLGIARAMWVNLRAGRIVQGGSTITQQAAKNLFLSHERTIKRKVQELLLAFWLEWKFTKDQILTLYLNRVYLGAGTYGVEAAAQRYFNKSARDVNTFESALLAGLLKAPSRYNPRADAEAARSRAEVVLAAMTDAGFLTPAQAEAARKSGGTAVAGGPSGQPGRHFADWVLEQVEDYVGVVNTDLVVRTTLDTALQRTAEQALAATLDGAGAKRGAGEGAVVVLSPDGAVRAMVGGRSYGDSQFNRATQAQRQPGSAFKPFVYLAGLEAGLTPRTVMRDAPVAVGDWTPSNYGGTYHGDVTLHEALALSLNTVAVQVSETAGRDRVVKVAERLGLDMPAGAPPSIALGTEETTLLKLVGAYAPFANNGIGVIPHGIREIRTRDGAILYQRKGGGTGRVIEPRHLGMMNSMLQTVIEQGTGKAARLDRPAGGKTGTTQEFRDAVFVGYTADYVAGVWLGNDDNRPMTRVTGGSLPAQVWRKVMVAAHRGLPPRDLPGDTGSDPLGRLIRSIFGDGGSDGPVSRTQGGGFVPQSRSRSTAEEVDRVQDLFDGN